MATIFFLHPIADPIALTGTFKNRLYTTAGTFVFYGGKAEKQATQS
jgi:hypothetical protein